MAIEKKDTKKWICKVCGHSVPGYYLFCTNCGARRPDEKGWICQNCGKTIPYSNYNYCIYCGSKRTIIKEVKEIKTIKTIPKRKREKTIKMVKPEYVSFCPAGYTIIEKIGSGGFSDVYKAKDSKGKIVALKIPRIGLEETTSGEYLKRFLDEAKIWSKLKHPNIVKVYDYGSRPIPWIIMEYMEGGSLMKRLKKGPIELKEALKIAIKIADAIQFAHFHGVIQQDINPKNILFTKDGIPKLTDWGLLKVLLETSSTAEVFEGTFICAAPEQLDPERFGTVDWRTDIYAFGVTLYWMLSGNPPFAAKTILKYIKKILEEKVKSLHKINPSIPRELDSILEKLLAKRKEDRYEAIALVKRDLQELLDLIK